MRILFISDYSLEDTFGGAQQSNEIIRREGVSRGHDIDMLHFSAANEEITRAMASRYDVVISSNLEAFAYYKPHVLKWIFSLSNHVRLEHDSCMYLNEEARKQLFRNCLKTFFLTNFHVEFFHNYYGDIFKNIVVIPDPIDTKVFRNMHIERSDRILYTGFIHPLKGISSLMEFAKHRPNLHIDVYGWGEQRFLNELDQTKNITYKGKVKHSDMPTILNLYQTMFHYPIVNEPFCRSVGEAFCCGIRDFICNDKIGFLRSIQEDPLFVKKCETAPTDFWKEIESI